MLREDVLIILKAFRQRKQKELRKENDKLVKQASLNFNKPVYELAVLAYVLSKIVSKPRFLGRELQPKLHEIEQQFNLLLQASDDEQEFSLAVQKVEQAIGSLESQDARFLTSLVSKGRLKIAAIMYAQGISLGRASEMTGMNKQDILDYAGKTMMFDRLKEEKSIHYRLKIARGLIG